MSRAKMLSRNNGSYDLAVMLTTAESRESMSCCNSTMVFACELRIISLSSERWKSKPSIGILAS